ncbi:hypothetical protein JOQ06_006451 [Pogonophryne albipinna]|uniref:Cadherin domain-containing protein n=1 Tax=Pogonophryne albipinna TaxID=1090488 RepID=A0AAD6F2U7_9TELE|nr:hypothetical protein JOQ06_006451 [Pogonophryne albipinna]
MQRGEGVRSLTLTHRNPEGSEQQTVKLRGSSGCEEDQDPALQILVDPSGSERVLKPRRRRSWLWNQFFVIEEYQGPEPVLIGRSWDLCRVSALTPPAQSWDLCRGVSALTPPAQSWDLCRGSECTHSPCTELGSVQAAHGHGSGDGRTKYLLEGEGAGSVFVIDRNSGNIHVTKPLDREEKAEYRLLATATDRQTGRALEPSSTFIIRVQDINDNPPVFPTGPTWPWCRRWPT